MTRREQEEFWAYLRNCTDAQVRGVFKKEREAGRDHYAFFAKCEAERRGFDVEE